MEAKDTEIRIIPQMPVSFAQLLSKYGALSEFQEIIKKDRQAQAEISFKAGIREVVEWFRQYAIHGSKVQLEDVLIDLKAHSPYGNPN